MKAILLACVMAGTSAYAQDPVTTATQQIEQLGLMSAQQAQMDAMATGQATLQSMNELMDQTNQQVQSFRPQLRNYPSRIPPWSTWKISSPILFDLSVKSGVVKPGTKVRIKWRGSDYSAVYYTTDGWTPTLASNSYTGPIPITANTHLQVIGIEWSCGVSDTCTNWARSPIVDAYYDVATAPASPQGAAVITDGLLRAGTTLQLVTGAEISSNSARRGDEVSLLLAQDVMAGGKVVIPKGTPVDAVLTQAIAPAGNAPGLLQFGVHSLQASGVTIKLLGGATMEGRIGRNPSEAVIKPGMSLDATVVADVKLKP